MALEKQSKEVMLSGMTARQKGMIGAMVIIVLIVIWQVIGLMGGGVSAPPPSPPTKSPATSGTKMTNTEPAGMNAASTASGQVMQQAELRQAQVASDAKFLQMQQMTEQRYISKINDLEDLKIQREIAETNQAIAAAKLATVTAEKNISDLLTKPAAPEVPQGTYANKLVAPTLQGENVGAVAPVASVPSPAPSSVMPQVEYKVISVSMQLGKWSAVIGYQGKLYNVSVGDVLSADDSIVQSINKSGVVLKKEGKTRKISILLAI